MSHVAIAVVSLYDGTPSLWLLALRLSHLALEKLKPH